MNDSYSDGKADARGYHWDDVLVVLLCQSCLLRYGLGSHSLVGVRRLQRAECSLTTAIAERGLDATAGDAHFGLFSVISGSWAHGEALAAIGRLGADVDFGAPVGLPAEYVVGHPERPSEHLLSFASYYFANFVKDCGLDSRSILMDSDMDSNYHDIAYLSSPDLTSNQVIVVDTG